MPDLECQQCGRTQQSREQMLTCSNCGGMMVEAPFFTGHQVSQLQQPEQIGNKWMAIAALAFLVAIAVGAVYFVKVRQDSSSKQPSAVKQEPSKVVKGTRVPTH
jgi:uncharacterized membrane protein YvbJ